MTEEEIFESDQREKQNEQRNRQERKEQQRLEYLMASFSGNMKPYLPPFLNDLVVEFVVEPLTQYVELEHAIWAGMALLVFIYLLLTGSLNAIGGLLPPLLHVYVVLTNQDGRVIPMVMLVYWLVNKCIFVKTSKKEVDTWEHFRSYPEKKSAIGNICESYSAVLVVLLGLALLQFQNQWVGVEGAYIILMVVLLCKVVPGVGGNSSLGLLSFLMAILLAVFTVPGVISQVMRMFESVAAPVVEAPKAPNIMADMLKNANLNGSMVLKLGFAESPLDIIRKCAGMIPILWSVVDDLWGPGIAINTAADSKSKNESKERAGAGIYTSMWTVATVLETILHIYYNDTFYMLSAVLSLFGVVLLWRSKGKCEWIGRGKGVTITDARAGYGMVFGEGPMGLRVFILRASAILVTACLFITHGGNIATTVLLLGFMANSSEKWLAVWLGVTTLNLSLLVYALKNKHPLTSSLRKHTVDAYTPNEMVLT